MLELLVALDLVLGGELAQLVDRLGLEVGQVHPRVIGIRREGSGEDRRVLAGRVVVAAARGVATALLPLRRSARSRVLATPRAATLLLRSRVVVHRRLACRQCCHGRPDLSGALGSRPCCHPVIRGCGVRVSRRQERQLEQGRPLGRAHGQRSWARSGVVVSCSGSRAVNHSDLAGPGTGGDVGAPVSAHLADEPRPNLTHDGSPVEGIIPELRKRVLGGGRLGQLGQQRPRSLIGPPSAAEPMLDGAGDRSPASIVRSRSATDENGAPTSCRYAASGTSTPVVCPTMPLK